MDHADLDAVAHAAIKCDPEGLRQWYDGIAGRVHAYLRVRGAEDPDGLTQDVFLAAISRIGRVRGGWDELRAYVFTIAHARLVDELRQRSRRPASVAYEVERDARWQGSAEHEVLSRGDNSEVVALLDLLPEDQRDVITLRVLADLDVAQTAAVIGRSQPAVKKLQAKGLQSLKMMLATAGRGEED